MIRGKAPALIWTPNRSLSFQIRLISNDKGKKCYNGVRYCSATRYYVTAILFKEFLVEHDLPIEEGQNTFCGR